MLKTTVFAVLACFLVLHLGVSGFDTNGVSVFVKEGDSVTLNTNVTSRQDETFWYFYKARLAQVTADQTKICTDDECKERFRDRLKVNRQTGSLTITKCRNTDSGLYKKIAIGSNSSDEKTFNVTVHPAKRLEMKRESVKEGESVTLDSGGFKNPNDSLKWYFDQTLIAEITGDQSQICTDGKCIERFGDRLQVDHQTGSLTITNTTSADSGEYLLIFSIGRSRVRSFSVDVTAAGPSLFAVIGCASIAVLILLLTLCLVCCCKHQKRKKGNEPPTSTGEKVNEVHSTKTPDEVINIPNETSPDSSERHSKDTTNEVNPDSSERHSKDTTNEVNPDSSERHSKDTTNEVNPDSSERHSKDTTNEVNPESSERHSKDTTNEVNPDSSERHSKNTANETNPDSSEQHSKNTTNEVNPDSSECPLQNKADEVNPDSSERPLQNITNEVNPDSSERRSKTTANETNTDSSKPRSKNISTKTTHSFERRRRTTANKAQISSERNTKKSPQTTKQTKKVIKNNIKNDTSSK